MKRTFRVALSLIVALSMARAYADPYDDTIQLFKNAGQSAAFFDNSYGYAVFPTVGKGGFTIVRGGAMYAATVAGQKFRYTPLSTQQAAAPEKEPTESR